MGGTAQKYQEVGEPARGADRVVCVWSESCTPRCRSSQVVLLTLSS